MKSRIFKNVGHRGNRTPIYKESARKFTQPFQILHKSALMAVCTFSKTEIHTKRFLSRRGSPLKFLEHGKPHEASLHTKRFFTRSSSSPVAFHHTKRSPDAHFNEPVYTAQATLPQESDQLRLNRHLARTPPRPQRQEPNCSL